MSDIDLTSLRAGFMLGMVATTFIVMTFVDDWKKAKHKAVQDLMASSLGRLQQDYHAQLRSMVDLLEKAKTALQEARVDNGNLAVRQAKCITQDEAILIARRHARSRGIEHAYCREPDWMPHGWVISAIVEASEPIPYTIVDDAEEPTPETRTPHPV